MGTKLYVGSLSFDTSDDGLRELFAGAGTVNSAQVVRDRDTGASRGFGFVEMATEEEAKKAVSLFNGATLDNRTIKVDEARPREARTGGFGSSRSNSYGSGRNDRGRSGGNRNRW